MAGTAALSMSWSVIPTRHATGWGRSSSGSTSGRSSSRQANQLRTQPLPLTSPPPSSPSHSARLIIPRAAGAPRLLTPSASRSQRSPPPSPSSSSSASPSSLVSGGLGLPSSRASGLLPRRSAMRNGLLGLLGMGGGWLSNTLSAAAGLGRNKASEVEEALRKAEWPEQFPFTAEDFSRYDESPDTVFYSMPRLVTHIDDAAIRALTKYYETALPPANTAGTAVLDMCSSWVSHYPKNYKQERIVGMGMNEDELARNQVLTEYVVQDLNKNPTLPFADNTFDAITNAVSVDYLTRPLEVFKEMQRVLKPGGLAAMSFSNRCFWTKAISIWTSTGDVDHCLIVGSYFHYAGGFERPQALDISPNPGRTDPMYVVFSRKLPEA